MDPVRDHELYQGLESALGATVATTLMERLPPAPVDRIATKDDVAVVSGEVGRLRTDMDTRFEQVDRRFEQVDRRFDAVDKRLDAVDKRLVGVDGSIASLREEAYQHAERVSLRFATVEVALANMDGKLDTFRQELVGMHGETLAGVRQEIVAATLSQGRQMVLALLGSLIGLCTLAFLFAQLIT